MKLAEADDGCRNQLEDAATSQEWELSGQANSETHEKVYSVGHGDEFQMLLRRRSAANAAAHLLPRLDSGMRLLDVGCGSGTISMGLADAVAPGEFIGVDLDRSKVELAKDVASAGGHENADFQVADALQLPFESNSFDVVHSHALMMYMPAAGDVAAEMLRVLKPGGIISCRDLILSSCFTEPSYHSFDIAWRAFGQLFSAAGAHPEMGKEIRDILLAAGFSGISVTESFERFSAGEDVDFFRGFTNGWFFSDRISSAIQKLGLASAEDIGRWRGALDQWQADPAATLNVAWGEAIGVKPE